MLQDIEPHKFQNEFVNREPEDKDYVFFIRTNEILMNIKDNHISLPTYAMVCQHFPEIKKELIYLFSIDQTAFYLFLDEEVTLENYQYENTMSLRTLEPQWLAFAGATAAHLAGWYQNHRYCGRCAHPMKQSQHERAMCCPSCNLIEYPKISPVVIVAITNGENLLLTKYAGREYVRYALIAGFMEIGETLEDTVRREVMEEVGLKVKNIRYYKSQPWAFSESILAGFFVDLDGSDKITLDENELSEAVWMTRDEIPKDDSTLSLTWEMIDMFRKG